MDLKIDIRRKFENIKPKDMLILTLIASFLMLLAYCFGYYSGATNANVFFQNYIANNCLFLN